MTRCDYCPKKHHECYKLNDYERMDLTVEEAEKDLLRAIKILYEENYDLIARKVNERCITNHLFHCVILCLKDKYKLYNFDTEYQKNGDETKQYKSNEIHYAIPDLMIHRRLCNNENLLIAEIKVNKSLEKKDIEVIKAFTSPYDVTSKNNYNYSLGVTIEIKPKEIVFNWYKDGKVVGNENIYKVSVDKPSNTYIGKRIVEMKKQV